MSGAKIIKQLLLERGMSQEALANELKIKPQSMRNKLYRDNFSFEEMIIIADILGCEVKLITKDTKKEFM